MPLYSGTLGRSGIFLVGGGVSPIVGTVTLWGKFCPTNVGGTLGGVVWLWWGRKGLWVGGWVDVWGVWGKEGGLGVIYMGKGGKPKRLGEFLCVRGVEPRGLVGVEGVWVVGGVVVAG